MSDYPSTGAKVVACTLLFAGVVIIIAAGAPKPTVREIVYTDAGMPTYCRTILMPDGRCAPPGHYKGPVADAFGTTFTVRGKLSVQGDGFTVEEGLP